MKTLQPKKYAGRGTGPRRFNGEILDIASAANTYGGPECTEKTWRSRVRCGLVPHRRWGGRIIFLKSELDSFFADKLPGLTLDEAAANIKAKRDER